MKIPLSWLKDFINLENLSIEEMARKLTLAGLEVDEIKYVGMRMLTPVPMGGNSSHAHEFRTDGIAWDKDKIIVAEIREVLPHPNADRLTLCDVFDGQQSQTVLTGAPNIFHLKGQGKLPKPLKVAYAKEGATLYDGHAEGLKIMTLKRAKIRGVESYSMVCSEKELGISEDHEGIILLDDDAPTGMPLADYMGDVVFDISILPNMARNANVIGVARELAAQTGRELIEPSLKYKTQGISIEELVSVKISNPELNPRFVLGLINNVEIKSSPYEIQRRLKLAGMRSINGIVDATNYAMLELGEPLHAFDYDVLKARAGTKAVEISTRSARESEKLTTLDGVERKLSSMNVLVCDQKGALSLAGIMGGAESEVTDQTRNVLLEGAAWNFINIRRTTKEHNLPSEASFRFSRGVHPAIAERGVKRGLQYMAQWAGGSIAPGLVDEYPLKPTDPMITLTPKDVKRLLGIDLNLTQIAELLTRLEFKCTIDSGKVKAKIPPHRLDIGTGAVGLADVLEEIARVYGYDRIPSTNMADALPPQIGNPIHEWEEHLRDVLITLGLDEVVNYRLISSESEPRLGMLGDHILIANPIAPEKSALRRTLLAGVLESLEHNIHLSETLAFFEIGPVFEPNNNGLPKEPRKLSIAMTGLAEATSWDLKNPRTLDFFDLKGRIELLFAGLHIKKVSYSPNLSDGSNYLHPGKAVGVSVNGKEAGVFGELHPNILEKYKFGPAPVLVADFDLEMLQSIASVYDVSPVPEFPPVLEDIALIVDEAVPAIQVETLIRQSGGESITNVRLFDVFRGEQIGTGKKSLAYNLTYQATDKTMTDAEAAQIRNKIVKQLEQELGAKLRTVPH